MLFLWFQKTFSFSLKYVPVLLPYSIVSLTEIMYAKPFEHPGEWVSMFELILESAKEPKKCL